MYVSFNINQNISAHVVFIIFKQGGMCGTHTLVKNNWITVTSKIDYVNITSSRATYISKVNPSFKIKFIFIFLSVFFHLI
jgi:hypothetical protein